MFATESECHGDYELTGILICLPAITSFFKSSNVHENAQQLVYCI